jgi:hypothetical protein
MANNAQKTALAGSLNRFAEKKVLDALQLTGKALPCSVTAVNGAIVTVKFEITSGFTLPSVTIPQAMSKYVREPTQVGDLGVVVPADAYMGGISGLGGGVADLTQRANLSTLMFQAVSNKGWPAYDPNACVIVAPNGAVLRDTEGACILTLTPAGVTIVIGGSTLQISGTAIMATTGTFTVNATTIDLNGTLNASGNSDFGGGSKKVALDGDPVVGGTVRATSTTIKAT